MNAFEVLSISQDLAALTYFLGTLFMALPIPLYGVKKWGPKMISDGIYSTILVNLYETILYLVSVIGNQLGTNWPSYMNWLYELLANELSIFTVVRGILTIIGFTPLSVPFSLVLTFLSGFITITGTLIVISQLIYNNVGLLIALGVLMLSLPFRIGRAVGGGLMGFAIVFYVGLPLLPAFLSTFGVNVIQDFSTNINSLQALNSLLSNAIPDYIEGTVIMPTAYLGILTSLSLGVGSAIAGGYSRLPIQVDFV
ncbi:MAG: DNA import protein CedA [Metallosphaera yellowstonensis]|uniref:DNA import protein CedA n=1 Tax=Metallosphaera yellowstonensis TaxID=1111107 RepID=UPI00064EE48C|nr:DNA import protein CedA [Metallosphaera yellowstonensis]